MGMRIGDDKGRKMEVLGRAYSFAKCTGNMTWALDFSLFTVQTSLSTENITDY
jgi:hypothetical protein